MSTILTQNNQIMLKNISKLGRLLTKDEQKKIKAGRGTCAAQIKGGVETALSIDEAKREAARSGGHWCCDSCQSVGWLNKHQKRYLTHLLSN